MSEDISSRMTGSLSRRNFLKLMGAAGVVVGEEALRRGKFKGLINLLDPIFSGREKKDKAKIEQTRQTAISVKETKGGREEDKYLTIARETINELKYPSFFYPVSSYKRMPENFPLDRAEISLRKFGNVEVAKICYEDLTDLVLSVVKEGYNLRVVSGFRSIQRQKSIFDANVEREKQKGLSESDAINISMKYSSKPGFSEHHLGLAVDIVDTKDIVNGNIQWDRIRQNYNKGFYLWLRNNAYKYGFVISYPTGSDVYTAKLGSGYESAEPWHLRYVGHEMADYLFKQGYLDQQNTLTLNSLLKDLESGALNKNDR